MPLDRIAMPKFSKYDHICQCVQCGKSFTPKTKNQKFCSAECRKSEGREKGISFKYAKKQCECCGKLYKPKTIEHKYCSESCRRKTERERNQNYHKTTLNHLSQGKIGSVSELEMSAHYLREGYEVFRNVSPDGPIDIIIFKKETGELHLIDIKSFVRTSSPNSYILKEENKKNFDVKVVPYDYNIKQPLRSL
jgi:hypothetical protein